MAPDPFKEKANKAIQDAWDNYQTSSSNLNNPRYEEHTRSFTKTADGTFYYKTLVLEPASPAYKWLKAKYADDVKNDWDKNDLKTLAQLKYTVEIIGDPPATGRRPLYIALHGGGEGTDGIKNDDEWNRMRNYYKGAVASGVWVALRGIGDSWDMHFTAASYVLIDRLIGNMILFDAKAPPSDTKNTSLVPVDPNKVYLIGFSAGGDAVYRLSSRLAQRFAAVNMGGGHPGSMIQGMDQSADKRVDCCLRNLTTTPICLQVGELDTYGNKNRCQLVAQSAMDLDVLQTSYPKLFEISKPNLYPHKIFIHPTKLPDRNTGEKDADYEKRVYPDKHNSWEQVNFKWADPTKPSDFVEVVQDYAKWRTSWVVTGTSVAPPASRVLEKAKTNAILDWFNTYTRDPLPKVVVWDLVAPRGNDNFDQSVQASLSGNGSQKYWLDIGDRKPADVGPVIEVYIERSNRVWVYKARSYLRILLRPSMMVDMSKVMVKVLDNKKQWMDFGPIALAPSPDIIAQTLARNDPNWVFCSDIVLVQTYGVWSVSTTSPAVSPYN